MSREIISLRIASELSADRAFQVVFDEGDPRIIIARDISQAASIAQAFDKAVLSIVLLAGRVVR